MDILNRFPKIKQTANPTCRQEGRLLAHDASPDTEKEKPIVQRKNTRIPGQRQPRDQHGDNRYDLNGNGNGSGGGSSSGAGF